MRIFEIAVTGLLVTGAVWSLANGGRGRAVLSVLFCLDLIALLLHLITEGAHWQMAPAYLGVLIFAVLFLFPSPQTALSKTGAGAMIVLALFAACLSAALPVFRLPKPTGSFAVGTRVAYLVDESRTEDAGRGGKREVMIQIWYPAQPSRRPFAPYRRRRETTLLSSYQSVVPTNSRWNAPLWKTGNAFPVLLFNPAWNGRRTQNTYLAEDLASHGFVVVGIDHTYNSEPVAFPDGRVIWAAQVKGMDFASDSVESIREVAGRELLKQTADDLFVLDRMQKMNGDEKSAFYGRLDTRNAGALGHSFGGAVAAQASADDSRIHAALDIDGSLFGNVQREGLAKPFMLISEDPAPYTAEERNRFTHGQRVDEALDQGDRAMFEKFGGYRVFVHGSTHFSFTDKSLFSSLKPLSTGGTIPPYRQMLIVRAYTLAFFEKALLGKSSPLLERGADPFPEAEFQATGPLLVEKIVAPRKPKV